MIRSSLFAALLALVSGVALAQDCDSGGWRTVGFGGGDYYGVPVVPGPPVYHKILYSGTIHSKEYITVYTGNGSIQYVPIINGLAPTIRERRHSNGTITRWFDYSDEIQWSGNVNWQVYRDEDRPYVVPKTKPKSKPKKVEPTYDEEEGIQAPSRGFEPTYGSDEPLEEPEFDSPLKSDLPTPKKTPYRVNDLPPSPFLRRPQTIPGNSQVLPQYDE